MGAGARGAARYQAMGPGRGNGAGRSGRVLRRHIDVDTFLPGLADADLGASVKEPSEKALQRIMVGSVLLLLAAVAVYFIAAGARWW
jgi:hypothetical protein